MTAFVLKDETGKKYGMLTVIHRDQNRGGHACWECVCECGKTAVVYGSNLRRGHTKSCGCATGAFSADKNTKHGFCGHTLYNVWSSMIARCNNPNNRQFRNYGGREIKACSEWKDSETFIKWALANGWEPGLQIDRENNDKGYNPENCRFVSCKENIHNGRPLRSTNKSGYKGVYLVKRKNKFAAGIGGNDAVFEGKKRKHLGYFNTAREAAIVRDQFIIDNNLPFRKLQVLKRS